MKIILINPPSQERYGKQQGVTGIVPPLGLAYMASYLREDGHDVKIIDSYALAHSLDHLLKLLGRLDYDVIGITAFTLSIDIAFQIMNHVKKINPNCTTILGGTHASAQPLQTLNENPSLDIVIKGEGEEIIRDVVKALEKHKSLKNIKGLVYRKKRIIETPDRPLIENLDSIPLPAYDLLPMREYRPAAHHALGYSGKINEKPYFPIITSRGCPFKCSFCASSVIWKRRVRFRSAENVLNELDILTSKYKIRNLDIYDDTFTLDVKRVDKILSGMVKNQYNLDFSCITRVDRTNSKILQKLKKAGCYSIRYGVESGSPDILKAMHKGFTKQQVTDAFKLTRKHGIARNACFIFGHPGETEKTAKMTVDFAKHIDPDLAFFYILIPLPGTEVARIMTEKNLIVGSSTKNWTFVTNNANIRTEALSANRLIEIRKQAYRQFYLRPSFILNKISRIKSMHDVKLYYRGISAFLASA